MRQLIAVLCFLIPAAAAFAEPYPQEARAAFTSECEKSGGPPATCACVLKKMEASIPFSDLEQNKVPTDQITKFTTDCLTETGDLARLTGAAPPPAGGGNTAPVTAPSNFGPECKRYFEAANKFCSDPGIMDSVKVACPQWKEGLKQMESALSMPGVTQDVINSMEPGCKAGADGVEQSISALKGATP